MNELATIIPIFILSIVIGLVTRQYLHEKHTVNNPPFGKEFKQKINRNSSNTRYCEDCGLLIIAKNSPSADIVYFQHQHCCKEGEYHE